jgi:hypothetical protein
MNTYKTSLIIALLCVANILGAEKKDALVCGDGSAESEPKSNYHIAGAVLHDIIHWSVDGGAGGFLRGWLLGRFVNEILPNFGVRFVNEKNEFTIYGCAQDCQILDYLLGDESLGEESARGWPNRQPSSIHSTVSKISRQEHTRADKTLLDGMTLTLVSRLLCLPQKNTLTNLKNWQKSVFSTKDNIPRQICCGQNSIYRNSLSNMLKILSVCKAVSSNLDQSDNQLVCHKTSIYMPCGQSQVHRFLRTKLDEQNLKSLANTGCEFKKLVGPICHKLRKIDPESEAFMPLAIKTFSTLGALVTKPKNLCVEYFKDDPLLQAAIQNDPRIARIDSWEIGDLINKPARGTRRPRSE